MHAASSHGEHASQKAIQKSTHTSNTHTLHDRHLFPNQTSASSLWEPRSVTRTRQTQAEANRETHHPCNHPFVTHKNTSPLRSRQTDLGDVAAALSLIEHRVSYMVFCVSLRHIQRVCYSLSGGIRYAYGTHHICTSTYSTVRSCSQRSSKSPCVHFSTHLDKCDYDAISRDPVPQLVVAHEIFMANKEKKLENISQSSP